MTNQERYDQIEEALKLGFLTVNDWENNFLNSMYFKLLGDKQLSWKQQKKLIEIWEKIE